jgi:aspartyl-tRNA(Asn)/glutamyl-tRNA(Gln) amidotransferase subunit C
MEQLSATQVLHMAKLSRLSLTNEEATQYAQDLGKILDYASHLPELDAHSEPSTLQVAEDKAVTRDNPHALLANAVALENGSVKVPAILDKSES